VPKAHIDVGVATPERVLADEAPHLRVVVARAQVVVAGLRVPLLAGEGPVVVVGAALGAHGAKGIVAVGREDAARGAQDVHRRADAVGHAGGLVGLLLAVVVDAFEV
jgi:hypothetical protein